MFCSLTHKPFPSSEVLLPNTGLKGSGAFLSRNPPRPLGLQGPSGGGAEAVWEGAASPAAWQLMLGHPG